MKSLNHLDECSAENIFAAEVVHDVIKTISLVLDSECSRNLTSNARALTQQILVQCIRYTVLEGSGHAEKIAFSCANWLSAIMDRLCVETCDSQHVLDWLLEPAYAWPLCATSSRKSESISENKSSQHADYQESRHGYFAAFIDEVASLLGWKVVIASTNTFDTERRLPMDKGKYPESDSKYRIWLLIEMLCTWYWPGGSAVGTLLPFLVSCMDGMAKGCEVSIIDNVDEVTFP
ncbi:hypothetical protein KP509_04G094400 [Ceratopteris richardii]|uniref:E3 ubiquitin-protein ligase listerin n=1 Tax=Ceratopteris richardii TaxID=49495 RepID=A0A8T2V2Y8_CERRI|nr:hypothetical protein KP509_04G094400 [Ceratopteris richardii]